MTGGTILFSNRRFICTLLLERVEKNPEFWGNGHLEINQLNAHKKYELIIGK